MQLARYPHASPRRSTAGPDPEPDPAAVMPTGPRRSVAAPDSEWIGLRVVDEAGMTVGRIEGTLQPDWLIVRNRVGRRVLAPAWASSPRGDAVALPLDGERLQTAPEIVGPGQIEAAQLAQAREHFDER